MRFSAFVIGTLIVVCASSVLALPLPNPKPAPSPHYSGVGKGKGYGGYGLKGKGKKGKGYGTFGKKGNLGKGVAKGKGYGGGNAHAKYGFANEQQYAQGFGAKFHTPLGGFEKQVHAKTRVEHVAYGQKDVGYGAKGIVYGQQVHAKKRITKSVDVREKVYGPLGVQYRERHKEATTVRAFGKGHVQGKGYGVGIGAKGKGYGY